MMNDRAKLKELFIAYQTRFKELKDRFKQYTGHIAERDSVIEKLNTIAREQRNETQRLRDDVSNLKRKLIEKNEEIERLKRDLIDIQRENERLNALLLQYQQANERLTAELNELRKAYEDKCKEVNDAIEEIRKLKATNAELAIILERLRAQLEQLKREYAELLKQYALLQEENKRLRKGNDILLNEMENLKRRYDDLLEKYNLLLKVHKENLAENDKLRDSFDDYTMKFNTIEAENAKYSREVIFIREKFSGGVGNLQAEHQRLSEINNELREANRRLKDSNNQLNNDLNRYTEDAKSLKMQLDDLIAERLKKKEDRKQKKAERRRQIEEVKQRMTNLTPSDNPDNPVVMYSKKPGSEEGSESILKKPVIKAFLESEQGMGGNIHYITHPCPHCMPEFPVPCPLHNTGFSTTHYTIEEAKTHITSGDELERISALESIIEYAESNADFKKSLENKYENVGVVSIFKNKGWENFVGSELKKYHKEGETSK